MYMSYGRVIWHVYLSLCRCICMYVGMSTGIFIWLYVHPYVPGTSGVSSMHCSDITVSVCSGSYIQWLSVILSLSIGPVS